MFRKLGYIDIQSLSHRIKTEIKMYTALPDDKCPTTTQFAAYNKIPGDRKQVYLYPKCEHEMLEGYQDNMRQYILEM